MNVQQLKKLNERNAKSAKDRQQEQAKFQSLYYRSTKICLGCSRSYLEWDRGLMCSAHKNWVLPKTITVAYWKKEARTYFSSQKDPSSFKYNRTFAVPDQCPFILEHAVSGREICQKTDMCQKG